MQQVQTKLKPQAILILDILDDRAWHCPIEWKYADGHTKRFTDINRHLKPQGLEVEGKPCDCGRHDSKVYKRRIIPLGQENPPAVPNFTPRVTKDTKTFCCLPNWKGQGHAPKCKYALPVKQEPIKQASLF